MVDGAMLFGEAAYTIIKTATGGSRPVAACGALEKRTLAVAA
jgi:hypothetical protein